MVSLLINFFFFLPYCHFDTSICKTMYNNSNKNKNRETEWEGMGLGKPISIDSPIPPPERWSLFPALVIISHNPVNVFFKLRNT